MAARLYDALGFAVTEETGNEYIRTLKVERDVTLHSLRDFPERLMECQNLLLTHFIDNTFIKNQAADPLKRSGRLPQGYFMFKKDRVIGWAGLIKNETVVRDDLSPWILPLLIASQVKGNHYGKLLLDYACTEALRLGFEKVYLTTDHIGYYEKYNFTEIGLTKAI